MKKIIKISLLFLLSVLSFSCGEDDDAQNINEAESYLFNENTEYNYLKENIYQDYKKEYKIIIETFKYNYLNNLKIVEYEFDNSNGTDRDEYKFNSQLSSKGQSIFGNMGLSTNLISGVDPLEILNLSKTSWHVIDTLFLGQNLRTYTKVDATRIIPDEDIMIGDSIFSCIKIKYNTIHRFEGKVSSTIFKLMNYKESEGNVWYAKNLGIVKETSDIYEISNSDTSSYIEEILLLDYKTK
jgi:hypothetical protein